MTQLQSAQAGILTPAMATVAKAEGVAPDLVLREIAAGRAVIPLNPNHRNAKPVGVGRIFTTKINANLGRSPDRSGKGDELEKLQVALNAGADFVMDLSVGAEVAEIRQGMLDNSPAPLGTVPVYETLSRIAGDIPVLNPDLLLQVIEEQARQGVDFMTLHAGLLREHIPLAVKRKLGIVSRGGAIMAEWMQKTGLQNPLYTRWDEVLNILARYDVTVSLGDGLRPGCLADASDAAQFAELDVLGDLCRKAKAKGVQVMIEGPGHIPFNEIQMNMERQQKVCDGAPFYVLGPVVIDCAPGYDHIVSAIGATAAATYGASLLCYVTPGEHLGLPDAREVHEGCIAYKIAAHAGDVARKLPGARLRDDRISDARARFDWKAQFQEALDP
ncbi:MAG: phosphomethylpyrimidine synthase ThiC, partial [Kiritimatiellia bacterium]